MLEIKNLKVYYKTSVGSVKAVDNVSCKIDKNEVVGITGESGCGKSTFVKAILRLNKPPCHIVGGQVLFNGIDLVQADAATLRKIRMKHISYIPQSAMNSLNPVMSVGSQIQDLIEAHEHVSKDEAKSMTNEILEMVGLSPEIAKAYPHELSGGMKQRVAIAIGVVLKPELIIADEPTTALDVITQKKVLQGMEKIRKQLGASMILVTHDISVQAQIAHKINIFYAGKLMECGPITDLFEDPLHPYTKSLLSAVPSLEKKKLLSGLVGQPPSLLNPPHGCRFFQRCPSKMNKCVYEEPELFECKPGHFVACHLIR